MKKLFELAGLSKRQTKKILENDKNLFDIVCGLISDTDKIVEEEDEDEMFRTQSQIFERDESRYDKRQVTQFKDDDGIMRGQTLMIERH